MKQIRLTKDNEDYLFALVRDSNNNLLTVAKAANFSITKGAPTIRKLFVGPLKKKGGSK